MSDFDENINFDENTNFDENILSLIENVNFETIRKNLSGGAKKAKVTKIITASDKITNLTGMKRPTKKNKMFYKVLKYVYQGVKFGASAAGTVVSMGAAGDTLPDLIFLIIDTIFLARNIGTLLSAPQEVLPWIKKIMAIQWNGDPIYIKNQTEVLLNSIAQSPVRQLIIDQICETFTKILDTLAAVFSSLVATFIPSDAGVSRLIIENIISTGASYANKAPFAALAYFINLIPQKGQTIINNKKNLKKFIIDALDILKGAFPNKNDSLFTKFKKNVKRIGVGGIALSVLPIIPGGIIILPAAYGAMTGNILASTGYTGDMVINMINKYLTPNVDNFVDLVHQILSLVFSVMTVIANCGIDFTETTVPITKEIAIVKPKKAAPKVVKKIPKILPKLPIIQQLPPQIQPIQPPVIQPPIQPIESPIIQQLPPQIQTIQPPIIQQLPPQIIDKTNSSIIRLASIVKSDIIKRKQLIKQGGSGATFDRKLIEKYYI